MRVRGLKYFLSSFRIDLERYSNRKMDRNALIAAFVEKYSFGNSDLDEVFREDVLALIDTLLDPDFDPPLDSGFEKAALWESFR